MQCEDYASAPSAKAAACKAAPQALFRPDTCWLHEVIPVKFLSVRPKRAPMRAPRCV